MHTPPKTIRVSVPVTPEVLAKFQRFAEVSGLSVGKSMSDWLRDTMSGLDAMIDILESHKRKPSEAMEKLTLLASSLQEITAGAIQGMKEQPSPLGEGVPATGKSLAVAKAAMLKAACTSPPSNTGGYLNKSTTQPKGSKS